MVIQGVVGHAVLVDQIVSKYVMLFVISNLKQPVYALVY